MVAGVGNAPNVPLYTATGYGPVDFGFQSNPQYKDLYHDWYPQRDLNA